MDIPIGFVCYNYPGCDITMYSRTSNITNTISLGVGGYVNNSYHRTLADKVDKMYRKDSLTGLLNRIGYRNEFEHKRNDEYNFGQPITVIMSDLDGLKYINDNYGHADGDFAIRAVANALKNACPEDAICVRFGGDEMFAIIIGECDIDGIISKVDSYLTDFNKSDGKEYRITASCGSYSSVLDENYDIKHALRIADEKMYVVKRRHQRDSKQI
jgi:diguanylate cyclase (GGDEF)-like protein